jgi:hypothetical protein
MTIRYSFGQCRIGVQEGGGRTWTVYNGKSPDAMPYADFNSSGTLLTRYVSGPGMVNGAVVGELLARTNSGRTTAWPDRRAEPVSNWGSGVFTLLMRRHRGSRHWRKVDSGVLG